MSVEDALFELAVVFVLVLLNGVFALSELAVVSSRRPRLRAMAEAGRPGARIALEVAEDPGRFLSTVQVGITLVGVLAGAFSGSALGGRLAAWLIELGTPQTIAEPLGFGAVIALVTYLSIVIGELVPKRFALRNPESLACRVAPPMAVVSRVAAPVVWLLDTSSNLIFSLLGLGNEPSEKVTDEDLRSLVAEAERQGTIETAERNMIAGVMRLGDRPVRGIMTPRGDVDWVDATASVEDIRAIFLRTNHSRLPVGEGTSDAMIGVIQLREVLAMTLRGDPLDIRTLARRAPVVPDTTNVLDVLSTLQQAEVPMALVHDEYGHFEGVVTPADFGQVIVGSFSSDTEVGEEPAAVQREDGSWLLAGWMPAEDMAEHLNITLPAERGYQTVAGFVLQAMGHLPGVGEIADIQEWRFEVIDLDSRRIDKVMAAPVKLTAIPATRRPGTGPDPKVKSL